MMVSRATPFIISCMADFNKPCLAASAALKGYEGGSKKDNYPLDANNKLSSASRYCMILA